MVRSAAMGPFIAMMTCGCNWIDPNQGRSADDAAPPDPGGDADADADADVDADTDADTDLPLGNGSIATADALVIVAGGEATVADAIEAPGDRDFFVFDGRVGHGYRVYVDAGGEAAPDGVVRTYDPAGLLLAENDDVPFRTLGTDPGTYIRPLADGPHYVEVLEWSDWAGEAPQGDPAFVYTLSVTDIPIWEGWNEDTHADDDDPVQALEDLTTDFDGDGDGEIAFQPIGFPTDEFLFEAAGSVDPAGDEDWLAVSASAAKVCQFAAYPGLPSTLDWRFELYREDCDPTTAGSCEGFDITRVAESDPPDLTIDYGFLYRGGITYPMPRPGMYTLRVADRDGSGGPDHWYSLLFVCYTPALATFHVEDGETSIDAAMALPEVVSTSDPDFSFARFVGFLDHDEFTSPVDLRDAVVIDWADPGDTIEVTIDTTVSGSSLDDAEVGVYREDSPGNWAEIGSASGPAPSVISLVAVDDARIAISIQSASGAEGKNRYYLGVVKSFVP